MQDGCAQANACAGVWKIKRGEIYRVAGDGVGIRFASKGSGNQRFHDKAGDGGVAAGKHLHSFAILLVRMKEVSGVFGESGESIGAEA
jgi:hypothetical protein